ncbi:MAG TPA: thiamine pyrophosphate-dependent enzyme [Burkholderiales bacterium]|nr:thiamine pyrophosphate-dependent enzyme [Burkholderiales bacterium]
MGSLAEHVSTGSLDRREVIKAILDKRGDALVVTGLGSSCYDAGVYDHPNTFYLWGAMGAAAMVGLGLALAQPKRRVVVVTGDGEMLMGLGALATIGAQKPSNLAILVMDNELYAETGMQPTHTARGVDLAGMAKSAGFAVSETVHTQADLDRAIGALYGTSSPVFIDVKVSNKRYPMSIRMRDGAHIKNRFRENLLGSKAFD